MKIYVLPNGRIRVSASGGMFSKRDNALEGIVSIANVSMVEGNSGTTNMVFIVTLSAAQASDVTFDYATLDGTATAGTDYTAVSGSKTITAGGTSTTVTVPIIGDTVSEPEEMFYLQFTNIRYS